MINIKKLKNDYLGKGKNIILPYSKKLTNGEVNISKYSGLVSVIKRRGSSELADEWSSKIFGAKFSKSSYTSKIPAVIARQIYVLETMKNKILDYIRKMEYNPNIGPLMKYLLVVITNLFVFFYGSTSVVFNKINEMLPEWAIILLGPFIVSLFLLLLIPVTFISSLIISLINMKWLLHRNMNTDDDYKYKNADKPVWMYIDPMSNAPNFLGSAVYIIIGLLFAFNFGITPIPYLIGLI